ncbi:hypothetical protein ASG49_10035 [Marmoricola sp. Leaf446]|uniref:LPXTG cell wall anchor domain-containing protein n=1 Tax=Marmoricola sp. Leaf446 TaxID=1736379 RepID=UPI00070132F7|nr:LPXTG cell wall anchor domain-containing protein [Marmoricola sp. Leaf446]KQT92262.1 hypothetical protein ASG49_10035 [Marmoricola sp. Leaf446]
MKVTRLIAVLVAAFFVLLAPTAAQAYEGSEGDVVTTPGTPSGNGCETRQVTVTGQPGDTLTLTVRGPEGNVVFRESQPAGPDGSATFTVEVCGPGTFTGTGTDQDGGVLGSVEFAGPAGGQGGPASGDDGTTAGTGSSSGSSTGNLPATGMESGTTLGLVGALALLLVGGVTLVAARRKAL